MLAGPELGLRVTVFGLGRVLEEYCEPSVGPPPTSPVFREPFLDIPLLMVVAEALELDLLKFSFELFVFPLIFDFSAGLFDLVSVEVREPKPDLIELCAGRLPLVLVPLDLALEIPLAIIPPDFTKDLVEEVIEELMLL
jgi:hypothetical protein